LLFADKVLFDLNVHKSNVAKLEPSNWTTEEEIIYTFQLDTRFFHLSISVMPVYLPSVKPNKLFEPLEKNY